MRSLLYTLNASNVGFETALDIDITAHRETARSLFSSVESSSRQLCYMASGYLVDRVPELAMLDLPFAVHDANRALNALDGPIGEQLTTAVETRTQFKVLAFWDNGLRHISNRKRPIRSPEDCDGIRIRTLDSPVYRAALAALGFVPVTTDVARLREAVASGEVDAQENPITNFLHFELWRHHRFLSLSAHLHGVCLLVCPASWYGSLHPEQRDALSRAVAVTTQFQRRLARAEDESALDLISKCGVDITMPAQIDRASMAARCAAILLAAKNGGHGELVCQYLSQQTPAAPYGAMRTPQSRTSNS
ncbi:MAG: TRAP transporter substrate-binding protein [Casimicrobium sp.]